MNHHPAPQTAENPRVPAPAHPPRHSIDIQMRFTDYDLLGHVNNNTYLSYADMGKVAYFERVSPEGMQGRVSAVIAHYDVDFYAPSVIGEKLRVETAATALGERSLHLEQRVLSRDGGFTKCIIRTVMVSVDPATGASVPLDPGWAEALCRYEGRDLRSVR